MIHESRLRARRSILLAAILLAAACLEPLCAQGAAQPDQQPPTAPAAAPGAAAAPPAAAPSDALPLFKPAEAPENPLLRLEIVSLGSFPITLFYTGFIFDLQRYIANGFNVNYAPWPVQSIYSAQLSDTDRLTRVGVALGFSLVVGGIDAYLHQQKLKKARRLHDAAAGSNP